MRILLTNCPPDAAEHIASDLVERRIAACVNAFDIKSTYRWEGAICRDAEVTLLIKVAEEAVAAAKARIVELHPYDLPEILVLPVDAEASLAPYVGWVRGEARGGERPDRRRLVEARSRSIAFLVEHLRPDGSFGPDAPELGAHYRAPAALAAAGWLDAAQRMLDHVARTWLTSEGCLRAAGGPGEPAWDELWALSNAWVALAAQRVGRYDLVGPILRSLQRASDEQGGGFCVDEGGTAVADLRATATIGMTLLAAGRVERAAAAGRWVTDLLAAQPDAERELFLRTSRTGTLVHDFEVGSSFLHVVRASEPRQAWLVVGHAIGFLVQLARATGDRALREPAARLMALVRGAALVRAADQSLLRDPTAHKVAWGAALWAQDTGDAAALAMAGRIAAWLVEAQAPDGGWSPEARLSDRLARTADAAIWLGELSGSVGE